MDLSDSSSGHDASSESVFPGWFLAVDRQRAFLQDRAVVRRRLRRHIEQELQAARAAYEAALQGEGPAVFSWYRQEFWIDRVRRIVMPIDDEFRWRSATTLPGDDDGPGSARE